MEKNKRRRKSYEKAKLVKIWIKCVLENNNIRRKEKKSYQKKEKLVKRRESVSSKITI